MAITSIKTGSSFTNLIKYNDFLGPNSAYIPSNFESIATATPNGVGTVTFSSIPQTYSSLQIRFSILNNQNGNAFELRLNNTTTNYAYHYLNGNGSTAAAGGSTSQSSIAIGDLAAGTSTTQPMVGIVDIHDYASTTKNKTIRNFGGIDLNGSGGVDLISGLFISTAAVTRLDIFVGGGTYSAGSTVSLYGIKG